MQQYSLEVYSFKAKVRLDDAGRFDPRPEDVLLGGDVVRLGDPVQRVQVVRGGVVQLVFARPGEALLHAGVGPQFLHERHQLRGQFALLGGGRVCEELAGDVLGSEKD